MPPHRPHDAPADAPKVPAAFAAAIVAYGDHLTLLHRPVTARQNNLHGIQRFAVWCGTHGITEPSAVTFDHGDAYAAHLETLRWRGQAQGKHLARQTRVALLNAVRGFYRWACRHGHATGNPVADVDSPVGGPPVTRQALTIEEVERLMTHPDPSHPVGLRDRAILEVLYSTGLRRGELLALTPEDIYADGVVRVLDGKGRRDRLVPIGARALSWVVRYRQESRPVLDPSGIAVELFISRGGLPMTTKALDSVVAAALRAAGITKPGGCHLLRHTCATLLLEGGASLKAVQRILGHAKMQTTAGYTHPSVEALRRVWAAAHPAAGDRDGLPRSSSGADAQSSMIPIPPATMPPLDGGVSRPWLAWWRHRRLQATR